MNPPDAAFCSNCSSSLAQSPPFIGQQPGQQQKFEAPGSPMAAQARPSGTEDSQKPMIALILAIAAFLCCGPFTGVPAAIVGWMELDAIKNGRSPASGKTMATIGFWGGIASTIIHGGGYVLWILLSAVASSGSAY